MIDLIPSKKFFSYTFRVMLLTICGMLFSAHIYAETFQIDGITYTTTSDNTCSVSRCRSSNTLVTIPPEVTYLGKTYAVTKIDDMAFSGHTHLGGIEFPNTVTEIGEGEFQFCRNLRSVDLPSLLTYISKNAFHECPHITKVFCHSTIPIAIDETNYGFFDTLVYQSATLYVPQASIEHYRTSETVWSRFQNISPLLEPYHTFTIDDITYTVTSDNTCSLTLGCNKDTVRIPQDVNYSGKNYTVTAIDAWAFLNASTLTSIELPDSLTSIGKGAFENCTNLSNIELPIGITSIAQQAFSGCNHKA